MPPPTPQEMCQHWHRISHRGLLLPLYWVAGRDPFSETKPRRSSKYSYHSKTFHLHFKLYSLYTIFWPYFFHLNPTFLNTAVKTSVYFLLLRMYVHLFLWGKSLQVSLRLVVQCAWQGMCIWMLAPKYMCEGPCMQLALTQPPTPRVSPTHCWCTPPNQGK